MSRRPLSLRPHVEAFSRLLRRAASTGPFLLALMAFGCDDDGAAPSALEPVTPPAAATVPGTPVVPSEAASGCVDGVCSETPPVSEGDAWNLCEALSLRAGVPYTRSAKITLNELLCELVDLDRLTRGPANYTQKMASSRDPASQQEGTAEWFANDDFGNYLRRDGDELVMMESHTPGAITRLWTATPGGILRIYIDDPVKPAIELDMSRMFSGWLGAPFTAPFLFTAAGGSNSMFPVPYARYARVTTTNTNPKFFYQLNYREYEPGTQVEPYSQAAVRTLIPLSGEVRRWMRDPSDYRGLPALTDTVLTFTDQARVQTASIGPGVIRELTVRGFVPTDEWLRKTRLIMRVDGVVTVDTPLGSLFTADLGPTTHTSVVASVRLDALVLRWPMPIPGKLEVELQSNGMRIGNVSMRLRHSRGIPAGAQLFHAQWSGPRTFNIIDPLDWKLIDFTGEGWYVGTVLNIANPVLEWWGEGDEKIFVDDEASPSLFGTGTEDYFGFGWCSNQAFAMPWNGQTRVAGALNRGRASMYRWHISDAIPFRERIRFNLEVLHWRTGISPVPFTQDALALWYARPGGHVLTRGVDLTDFQVPLVDSRRASWPFTDYDCRLAALLP
ncbi:MAG: DUF2961 domain-containing protein [Polyangiales bacterium]